MKKKKSSDLIKSPLGYTGGKYKLLPDILEHLPSEIDKLNVYDVFCGGLNVGINLPGVSLHANDIILPLIELYEWILETPTDKLISLVEKEIDKRELTWDNKEAYLELRHDYNASRQDILLLCLIFYSFNHMIRFNLEGNYNVSFGKQRSRYSDTTRKNLKLFSDKMKEKKTVLTAKDFQEIEVLDHSFVYCDPPYSISLAAYNTKDKYSADWNEESDSRLCQWLDELDDRGIKFMMSNVLVHNGAENNTVKKWSEKYNVVHLDMNYKNSSYHKLASNKEAFTDEVLIVNYR